MKQQEIIVKVIEANHPSPKALKEFNQSFLNFAEKLSKDGAKDFSS